MRLVPQPRALFDARFVDLPDRKNIGNNTLFRYSLFSGSSHNCCCMCPNFGLQTPFDHFCLSWMDWVAGGRNMKHKNCNPSGSPLSESLGRQQTRTQNGHLQLNSSGEINAHWLCALPLLYQRVYFSTLRNRKTLETTQCFATFSTFFTFASPGWIGWRVGETRSRVRIAMLADHPGASRWEDSRRTRKTDTSY